MRSRRSVSAISFLAVAFLMLLPEYQALAQDDFPNRPIEVVVPAPPGGPLDIGTRFFLDKWAEFLGQPVVVLNKGGAGGVIGAKYVARAKPDGYTLLATGDSHIIVSRLQRKDAGYDLSSFRLLFSFSKLVLFFCVNSESKWKTFNDFLKEAKENPGKLTYAATGTGSTQHVVMELVAKTANVKLTLVPFKSSPETLRALMGGNVDMGLAWALSGLGKSGKIKPLAVSGEERVPDYPDVPTLAELGLPIPYTSNYNGIVAPSKTPEKAISKLMEAHNKVRTKYAKEIKEKFPTMDLYPIYVDGKTWLPIYQEREKVFREFNQRMGIKIE